MRDLLMVGFLFVAIFYSFKRPYLGVAAWIWIALMAPAKWAFGFSQSFRLNLTIVLVTAVSYFFMSKNKSFQVNALTFWVLMFGFWTLVSTAFNINPNSASVWSYWNQFLKVMLLFIFILLTIKKQLHLNTLIWAIVLAISSYAAMEAVKFVLSGGNHRISGRPGIISDRNDLAVAINMCIPLVIYLIYTTKHKLLQLGLWGIVFLNVLSIVGTYSRGGFIGLAILAIFLWMKSRYKVVLAVLAFMLLPLLYQSAPEEWQERQSTVSTAAEEDSSFIGRLWAWKISTMIALDHPLTGAGFRAVLHPDIWNRYAPFTPDFPPIATPPIPLSSGTKAAHNIYFQVLGDHGFVGLGIFLAILLGTLLVNRANARAARLKGVDWYARLCTAIMLSLVGYCITGGNVSLAYFELLYAIVAIVVVMQQNREQLLLAPETTTVAVQPADNQAAVAGRRTQASGRRRRFSAKSGLRG